MFSIKSWPFLAISSKVEKLFVSLPSILFTSFAIVLIFEQQPGCVICVVLGGAFTRNYIKIILINASKYSNKHTPRVEAPCVVFLEQINCEFSSQILEGNRKKSNDEFLNQCGEFFSEVFFCC